MEEKILSFDNCTAPVSGTNHAFEEAVQCAVDARIMEFATALLAEVELSGSYLAQVMARTLKRWAVGGEPFSDVREAMRAGHSAGYCNACGNPYLVTSKSDGFCGACRCSGMTRGIWDAEVVSACNICHGSGYDHMRMEPCQGCAQASDTLAKAQESATVPLSPCCKAPIFEADGRRVCSKCRLTRPLQETS